MAKSANLSHAEKMKKIKLLKLAKQLKASQQTDQHLKLAFPSQRAFIQDPSELKTALCTRRAGKTWAAALYLLIEAMRSPGSNCLYAALSHSQAEAIMLSANGFITQFLQDFNIVGADINLSKLRVTLPNRSVIYIMGLDGNPHQINHLLGMKYKLAIFDEAGSYQQDLMAMINKIRPAMAEKDGTNGTICMIGTPENERGYFYYATEDTVSKSDREANGAVGWKNFRWSYTENETMRDAVAKQIDQKRTDFPGIDTDDQHPLFPQFQQHYMAKWVVDKTAKVYRGFNERVNLIDALPTEPDGSPSRWTYACGIDWGFVDAATIVTVCYREHDPCLYVVDVYKARGQDPDSIAHEIIKRQEQFHYTRKICDHNPSEITRLANTYQIYLEKVDEKNKSKVAFIELQNAAYLRQQIKLVNGPTMAPLLEELDCHIWNKKLLEQGLKVEGNTDNHCLDSLLYVWRSLYHYLAKEKKNEEINPLDQYQKDLMRRTRQRVKDRLRREKRRGFY